MDNEQIKRNLKKFFGNFFVFRIRDYDYETIEIEEGLTFKENLIANKMWARGIPKELEVFYKTSIYGRHTFWGSDKPSNFKPRHSNMANVIIKTLTDITVNDLNEIDIDNELYKEIWEQTEKDNRFVKGLNNVVKKVLIYGDGAFKINYKPNLQDTPFISFVPAEDVDYIYEDGRIKETLFKKTYKTALGKYNLLEIYGWGYIRYKLYDENMVEVPLSYVDDLKDLKDIVFYDNNGEVDTKINLAVPFFIWNSDLFDGRGRSVFEDRRNALDMLDNVLSIFDSAMTRGQFMLFIDKNLIPTDKEGNIGEKSPYMVDYMKLDHLGFTEEGKGSQVQAVEPQLQVDKYQLALQTAYENCLIGVLSPSTIGISSDKVNENALAEREKERVSIFTRNNIIEALSDTMEEVIRMSVKIYCYQNNIDYNDDYNVSILFGEWASPSFNSIIDSVSKASGGKQFMTLKQIQKELYPEIPEEEIDKNVAELEKENGLNVEGDYIDPLNDFNNTEDENAGL